MSKLDSYLPPARSGINKNLHSSVLFVSHLIELKVMNSIEQSIKQGPLWNALCKNINENNISFLEAGMALKMN